MVAEVDEGGAEEGEWVVVVVCWAMQLVVEGVDGGWEPKMQT